MSMLLCYILFKYVKNNVYHISVNESERRVHGTQIFAFSYVHI